MKEYMTIILDGKEVEIPVYPYSVKSKSALILGHKGEHDNKAFKFTDINRVSDESSLYFYLQYQNNPIGKIILCDNAFVLIYEFTKISTRNGLTGQIKEHLMDGDVEKVRDCSDIFKVEVRGSIGEADTPEIKDEHVTLWGAAIEQAYNRTIALVNDVQSKLDRGDFKGEKGDNYEITEEDYEAIAKKVDLSEVEKELDKKVEKIEGKGLSTNDYSNQDKDKLANLQNYDDTQIRQDISNKVDKVEGKGLSTNDYTNEDKQKLNGLSNYDDTLVKNDIANLQTKDEQIEQKIQDIELAKFPNVTIFGQPTINQGQISNFNASNYCQFPFIVNFQNQPFTLDFEITTGSEVNNQHNIFDSVFGLAFAVRQSRFVVAISTTGTNWNIGEGIGTHVIQPNSTYRIRMDWNKTNFTVSYSTDGGASYITDITKPLTEQPYPKQMFIGITSDKSTFFNGIINLNYSMLAIANKVVWQGMDDVGLATRADVSLSNLDAQGEARFAEINTNLVEQGKSIDSLESAKQDKLVSGQNIKTINGISIIGEGNIDIEPEHYDDTEIKDRLNEHNARIHTLERELGHIEVENQDWQDIIESVDNGYGRDYYPVGTQVVTDYTYSNTKYSCPQNIVDHNPIIGENGQEINGMTIEWEYTIPLGIPFDPSEALYCVGAEGLPKGTYHYKVFGDSWASQNNKVYQFTTDRDLTEGMHLKPSSAYNTSMNGANMQLYQDGKSFTSLANFVISEGADGIDLGTMGRGDLNHYHRVFLGYNRWKESFVRQWLNNIGLGLTWWQPQNKWDRAPSNLATLQGFLSGYSDEFVSILKPCQVKTYRNTVTDDGGLDITYDKVFLASFANWNCNSNQTIQYKGGEEGNTWEYYEKLAETSENLATNGSYKWATTYPELIRYALNAKTSPQYVFSRSSYRSHGHSVLFVGTPGLVDYNYAGNSNRIRPACVIRK